MKRLCMMLYLLALLPCFGFAKPLTTVQGTVHDEAGKPIAYANVFLRGTYDGEITDELGNFLFHPRSTGNRELTASYVGYKPFTATVDLAEGRSYTFDIVLKSANVSTHEMSVTASSFSSEEGKGLVLSPRDVVMTPGGAADIFQSLKTMPGVTLVSESAELYVRGGDPTETVTMIDNATLYHPYTFESSYGGLFSNVNTSSIQGMYFSSGGFSARYGNALSGVLDLKTKSEASGPALQLGLSIANASLTAESSFLNDALSFHVDGRQTLSRPLFAINGQLDRFPTIPLSRDADSFLRYKYSPTGSIKLVVFHSDDSEGVNVDLPEFSGVFNNTSNNSLVTLYHEDIIAGSVQISNSLSTNTYRRSWSLGAMNIATSENVGKLRTDCTVQLTPASNVKGGLEIERRRTIIDGNVPSNEYDRSPAASTSLLDEHYPAVRYGAYAEYERTGLFGVSDLMLQTGIRGDVVPALNESWFDPRVSVGYKINDKATLRLSSGIFHQMFDVRSMDAAGGTSEIKPMEATHLVFGTDYAFSEQTSIRCETYYKWYSHLPREISDHQYDNSGFGSACGVDIIAKGSLTEKISGWISYGFLNSKRYWMDYERLLPSAYDVTHNLTVILTYDLATDWQIGMSGRVATGTPYTPVTGALYRYDLGVYEPLYGDTNSDRLPTYHRLDCRVTHMFQLFKKYFTVVYLEGLNILNLENIFGYTYSRDYTQRREIPSYFGRRIAVVGGIIYL